MFADSVIENIDLDNVSYYKLKRKWASATIIYRKVGRFA